MITRGSEKILILTSDAAGNLRKIDVFTSILRKIDNFLRKIDEIFISWKLVFVFLFFFCFVNVKISRVTFKLTKQLVIP